MSLANIAALACVVAVVDPSQIAGADGALIVAGDAIPDASGKGTHGSSVSLIGFPSVNGSVIVGTRTRKPPLLMARFCGT